MVSSGCGQAVPLSFNVRSERVILANKRPLRPILIIATVVGVICVLCAGTVFIRCLGGYGITFHLRYKTIESGMSRERVIELLGRPHEQSSEFHLGQAQGFEPEYERARNSDSRYYLFWNKGIDVVYAVGFDSEDKVTIKAVGGT